MCEVAVNIKHGLSYAENLRACKSEQEEVGDQNAAENRDYHAIASIGDQRGDHDCDQAGIPAVGKVQNDTREDERSQGSDGKQSETSGEKGREPIQKRHIVGEYPYQKGCEGADENWDDEWQLRIHAVCSSSVMNHAPRKLAVSMESTNE
ncbi:hypothetical protein SDC9_102411 [bioreactor metagenome]|uniref:Uncharacterized protein n=1 Tax=bioreactor metagenome TaxID=1076179 RepID=A0A645B1L2_9ZZZZ